MQPGEKIPIDGVIVEGTSTLNTAALTGESMPRNVSLGDEVVSGCINETDVLKIKTTKEFGESTASKILELVENASSRKSKSEAFISKFARIYTPAVCYSALALAIIPPVVNLIAGNAANFSTMDIQGADLSCHKLPVRARHQHPAQLLRRYRRGKQCRCAGKGLKLHGDAVQGQVCRL